MKIINELLIRWHSWRMCRCYGSDNTKARFHMEKMTARIKQKWGS